MSEHSAIIPGNELPVWGAFGQPSCGRRTLFLRPGRAVGVRAVQTGNSLPGSGTLAVLCGFLLLFLLLFALPAGAQQGPLAGVTICVDPGHTSETSAGTSSKDGKLSERHVNWVVALKLKDLLTADGATVVLTKHAEEEVVANRRRAEIANNAHAALLLRLHCDAGSQSGFATFYPDRQGMRFGVTGPSQDVIDRSHAAAKVFHPAAAKALQGALPDLGIKGDSATFVGGKQGALTGSIFARVPALTVEMCVLTNAHDYAFIRTAAGQDKMARALEAGVVAFADK